MFDDLITNIKSITLDEYMNIPVFEDGIRWFDGIKIRYKNQKDSKVGDTIWYSIVTIKKNKHIPDMHIRKII